MHKRIQITWDVPLDEDEEPTAELVSLAITEGFNFGTRVITEMGMDPDDRLTLDPPLKAEWVD